MSYLYVAAAFALFIIVIVSRGIIVVRQAQVVIPYESSALLGSVKTLANIFKQ